MIGWEYIGLIIHFHLTETITFLLLHMQIVCNVGVSQIDHIHSGNIMHLKFNPKSYYNKVTQMSNYIIVYGLLFATVTL